jgi:hypothetical protein
VSAQNAAHQGDGNRGQNNGGGTFCHPSAAVGVPAERDLDPIVDAESKYGQEAARDRAGQFHRRPQTTHAVSLPVAGLLDTIGSGIRT